MGYCKILHQLYFFSFLGIWGLSQQAEECVLSTDLKSEIFYYICFLVWKFSCLFDLILNVPVNNFSVNVETSLFSFNQYKARINVSW